MPGTILLSDYEAANKDELAQHLADLMARAPTPSDSLTNPVIQAPAPLIAAPTPSDSLTNPVIQPTPEPSTAPQQTRDELQAHVDSLLAPPTPTAPPDVVSTPSASPRPLQLLGEGLTSLNAGAQNVRQQLQDHLTSLLAPPTPAPDVAPTPSDSLTNPVGTGNAAPPDRSLGLQDYARTAAQRAGIDPDIFVRQIQQESGFNPTAKSPAGAIGVAQFMPNTAQGMGIDPNDPYAALDAAATMDAQQLKQYGGDWGKTLAAYNAGPGAVEKFGGIPPFEETQRYVANILGGAKAAVQGAGQAISGALNQARGTDVSQFGDSQLTASEAAAACGPAAAVRFAQRFGRNPTLREATDLAASVGWTQGQGMAGIGSEKSLLDKMGVATKLVSGPDWGTFADEARTGNPVIISTAGHYFTADNWDPTTNKFHVGRSGLDLKGGAEWMTPEQMTSLMGQVQGGLLADNPTTPTSTATRQGFAAPGAATDQQAASVDQPRPLQLLGEGFSALGSGAQAVSSGAQQAAQGGLKIIDNAIQQVADTSGPQTAAMQPTPSDTLTNPLGTRNAPEQPSAQLTGQPAGGIAEPTGPAVLPSIGEAKDALLQGDTQAALDALNRAGTAISTSAPAQAIAENQANPPLAGAREAIANAPVLGGALGIARGPDLLSQDELLRTPEADTARAILEQMNRGAPVTDADVAEATRTLLTSQAVAMTGEGFGRPGETGRPLSRPGAEEPGTGPTQILGPRGEVLSTVPAAPEATGLGAPSEAAMRVASTGSDATEVARLRLDKFPDWLQPTIEDAARATDFAIEQRRGVIPNTQAEAMADQVGRSVDDWIKQSKIGTTLNTEETRALRNVITGQAQKVQDLAEQVSAAAERGQATDQLITQAAIEGNKLQDLTTMMEGARAEWGRAGSAWKAETRLIDLPPNEAISEIYKTLGGRDNALAAVQELNALQQSGATPIQLAKFWAKIKNPEAGFQDWVKALRYNSMLSGPRTIEVNGIGNALEIPWRMARDTGASLLRGRPEELAPEASGLVAGFNKGRQAFMETLTHGMTTEQALAGEIPTALADKVRNPALKPVAKVLDVPSRVLAASDAWGKSMAQSMALGRRAGVTASKEGLSGPEWHARVAELLDNPTRDMLKEADAISERMVYHGDMGSMGTALSQLQRVPYLGNAILPFLRTVYHIQARGIDRSPVGLAGTLIDVGRGKYGPKTIGNLAEQLGKSEGPSKGVAPLGERLGDNLAGTAATVGFFQKAQEGAITGAGPDDPEKRDMLRAQGWQPYSLKLGDHYVSYANWGPVATSLAMAAGAAEAIQYRKENAANVPAILVDASRRTAKLITEQSYLQGIGAVWKALEQPDRYSAQTLGQIMTSLVPFGSALNTAGQAMDPLQRQVGKPKDIGLPAYLGESVEARLPGLREQLPPQQDQLGRPIENPQSDLGALNPLRATPIKSNAVLQELLLKGADVGEPPTSVRNVDLTPAEQRTVNEKAGQYIERNVQQVMADPDYQKADADGKKRALSTAVERARRQAGGELLQSLSEAEITRRLEESRTKREPVPIGLGG